MCLLQTAAMDGFSHDGKSMMSGKEVIDAADEVFVYAPPSSDPACFLHVDAVPYREIIEDHVDALRAKVGLRPVSAASFRRRRAKDHQARAAEFVERRRLGLGAHDDELCRRVQAALDTGVLGACAYCGCNFSVEAVAAGVGSMVCGLCGRPVRKHQAAPLVRPVAADAEERWKGWLPW
ncbi:hypothetical protein ACP70R_006171 [Stipagrostis hirtigluma subsp. patula]